MNEVELASLREELKEEIFNELKTRLSITTSSGYERGVKEIELRLDGEIISSDSIYFSIN